ncbi:ParB N-terminal domain-containing protein [Enterococcus sp. BWB1-3]|nr:ParB N-terminal domain-containing protein [Enterococcus sp. BWB1-3]
MEIAKMKLSELKPAEYNPRINLEPGMEEYESLKRSLEEFGFVDPPIFNKQTGNLVGGHQRVAVAQQICLCDQIEVSVVDLPIEKEKTLNLALNKIEGKWENVKLAKLISELDTELLTLTGFSEFEIEELLSLFSNEEIQIEELYEDLNVETPKETAERMSWGETSIKITREDVSTMDRSYKKFNEAESNLTFVEWLVNTL